MYVSSGQGLDAITPNGTVTPLNVLANDELGGITFDTSGNLYVANNGNNSSASSEIDKITPNGVVSVYVTLPNTGLNVGLNADLTGLAFDSRGNLYAAEYYNGIVARITPDGIVSTFNLGQFVGATDLAFDKLGNLFVSESVAGLILKITPNGAMINFSVIQQPTGLAVGSDNNLYVSSSKGSIFKVTPSQTSSIYWNFSASPQLAGMVFDNDGNLFVAGPNPTGIDMISPIGAAGLLATHFNTSLNDPQFLAFAPTPEPASLSLCAIGCLTLLRRRRTA